MRNQVDRGAKVIAPPMVTRLEYQLTGHDEVLRDQARGRHRPVWQYFDAVALSLYPLPTYGRRTGVARGLRSSSSTVRQDGRCLPASGRPGLEADLEHRGQLRAPDRHAGGTGRGAIPAARQAANVMRTYLLNAADRREAGVLVPLRLGP